MDIVFAAVIVDDVVVVNVAANGSYHMVIL
jgi:hypothetical protein